MQSLVVCLMVALAAVAAAPGGAREGAAYSNEAIKQAQNTRLIPADAVIQKVRQLHEARFLNWEGRWQETARTSAEVMAAPARGDGDNLYPPLLL